MADVARLADVSTATVSHYLSGKADQLRRVGTDAQQRIAAAVAELGYVQNKAARHLRLQRTERICVLLPKLGIPFADGIARDVDMVARARGFSTIVVTGQSVANWQRVLDEVEAGLADAIFADADTFTAAELAALFGPRFTKPRLVLHPNAAPDAFSVINYDRVSALRQALDHLTAAGRRRFAYIQNVPSATNIRATLVRDYVAARPQLALAGIAVGAATRGGAVAALHELRARGERPDAILVESDFSAVSVVEELQRLGLSVPGDIAVVGCGNAEEGYYCYPRLTTIGPTEMSVRTPTEHLIDLIEGKGDPAFRRFLVHWSLLVRDSA
jgi:LacI family repressor for deo operon, udp, cdd, tsx, nupC, and nupG